MPRARYKGQHRAPSTSGRVVRGAAVSVGAAAAVATALADTNAASASPGHDWSGVAQCESSGNWHINTGNGFYGGLQFTQSTWDAFGGESFASRADLASESAQITVAERVLDEQGVGAWPVCGRYLTGGSTPTDATPAADTTPASPEPASPQPATSDNDVAPQASGGTYVVRSGDTLLRIADSHDVSGGWHTLAELNSVEISNPDLIYPGQTITL
jgi:resuscitation-promoting factor RpfA